MKRIMVNTSLNYLRDRSKENKFLDIDPLVEKIIIEEEDETDSMINPERFSQEMIMKMICELPAGYRTVFNMYVFEDYSHREIAEFTELFREYIKIATFKSKSNAQEETEPGND